MIKTLSLTDCISHRRRLPRTRYDSIPRSLLCGMVLLFCPVISDAEVSLDQGLVYLEARGPREIAAHDSLELSFRFRANRSLERRYELFVHVERQGHEPCRLTTNVPIVQGDGLSSERWSPGPVSGSVAWPNLIQCGPGSYDVFVGLWDPIVSDRLAVLGGVGSFDRILAGRITVRPGDDSGRVDDTVVSWAPVDEPPTSPPFELPLSVLLLLLALGVTVFVALFGRRLTVPDMECVGPPKGALKRVIPYLIPLGVLGAGVLSCMGFVKDDAYISFRYAHNLVTGRGMVFNEGEPVEGYTNFLWTLIMTPFDIAGADLIQVCDVLGPLLGGILVVVVVRAAKLLDGTGPLASHLWGAVWLASSSSFALWTVGGLEQSLATLLPFAGVLLTWRGWRECSVRHVIIGSTSLAGACLTRPEGHLFVVIVGLAWLISLRIPGPSRRLFAMWAAPLVIILAPYHIWRLMYFGALLPNTYLVKAVSGDEVYRAGFYLLADMLRFNELGVVIALAGFSLFASTRRLWRWLSISLAVLFMAYIVKIGTDELMWHRLFLPALPFVVLGAGAALRLAATFVAQHVAPARRWYPYAVGWLLVAYAGSQNLTFTSRETRGLGGYGGCSGLNHPDLGKFLTRHSRPGELVAFQDMGATPYHAPDLRFLDLVGLVDRPVALLLQEHGVHPFVGATRARRGGEFCVAFRDYVFERRPDWVVLVPWPSRGQVREVEERFAREDSEVLLQRFGAYHNTQFDCHLYDDPRFTRGYGHVRTWMRSPVYYLSTFRRRDLLEQPPPEVVLERPPSSLSGPRATFENGVELLGGHVEREVVVERHEVFVTTWWRLPGPLPDDLLIFVHITAQERPQSRTSLDHPAGDWMYPASRWRRGQVIEDRVLVQLPVGLAPGRYDIHVGLFNRRTGERVDMTSDDEIDDHRLLLDHVDVRPMRHFIDPLIPRTDPVEQRQRR